ncbi:unnamed protein product [Rhizoctonia solani]|uniref:protein-histidine N-methyltransferase n=1 Tax=Rhizoctonia solani TaxID=456999 RepID=A0A8H3I0S9_9AGAM|nr:unnamed protein product [Rhizoctonia solani]
MFKFDFDVEDDSVEEERPGPDMPEATPDDRPFKEHTLEELIQTLPDDISYSSVRAGAVIIPRRDLFDVRLQLMASETQSENAADKAKEDQVAMEFASRPSDLVPRVYEGGMKTWECSLDLAVYAFNEKVRGKRVLELGCGTAMPSLAILQELLNGDPPSSHNDTIVFHLQDYNSSVLEYVTLPNIVLVWFFSKAGEAYRATIPPPSPKHDPKSKLPNVGKLTLDSVLEEEEEESETPEKAQTSFDPHAFDVSEPGDLAFTPTLRTAFLDSLASYHMELRFFSGPWDGFVPTTPYDLVLTSETIYQPTSLPSLIRLLRDSTGSSGKCLVAAKLVYFGVGGGIREFEQALTVGGGNAAKNKIQYADQLHTEVTKYRTTVASRIIGSVLHCEKIEVGARSHQFTKDWSFIELDEDVIDWDKFMGSMLYVGGGKGIVDWDDLMFPQPHDRQDSHMPEEDLLQIKGFVPESEFHNPQNYDINNMKTLLAVKNG